MIKNNYSGKFIVIEGLDGSGQSTQVSLLRDFFIGENKQVILTKEPTLTSEAGKKIKQVLGKEIELDPKELQKLFAQDRKEHLDNLIIPALEEGKIIISDRYFFSSFAYGSSDEISLEWLIELNNDFLIPDLTIILKTSPEVCISRIEQRGTEKTLFEKTEKLTKVWEKYSLFPERFENVKIIDGEKTIEQVLRK
ncbi:MAG: dTMP kinase [Candidatus Nealsonbacteria bacterium]